MSLVSFIGPRPNIFDLVGNSRRKRLEVRQPILTNGDLEKIRSIGHTEDRFDTKTIDITYGAAEGGAGMLGARRPAVRAGRGGGCRRLQHHHPVRPAGRPRPHRHPRAAGHGGRAPSSDPQGAAHLGRPGRRIGRAARGASFLLPGRLWRRGDQPLSGLRYAARHAPARRDAEGGRRARGGVALHQVDRQGHPQGDVQDGHLDLPVLLRRADLRRRRAEVGVRRQVLLRHGDHDRGRRARGDRRRDGQPPRRRIRRRPGAARRRSRSAASICTACAARRISGRRTRWRRCSMRCARARGRPSSNIRREIDSVTARAQTIRGLFRSSLPRRPGARRCRSTRWSRRPTSSSASRPARCRSARSRARRTRRWRAP